MLGSYSKFQNPFPLSFSPRDFHLPSLLHHYSLLVAVITMVIVLKGTNIRSKIMKQDESSSVLILVSETHI